MPSKFAFAVAFSSISPKIIIRAYCLIPRFALVYYNVLGNCWDAGKDQQQKEKMAEDEKVRQHHQLSGHKSEQTLGDSAGRGGRTQRCDRTATVEELLGSGLVGHFRLYVLQNSCNRSLLFF